MAENEKVSVDTEDLKKETKETVNQVKETIKNVNLKDENYFYYENENGTDPREKFRIRMYNGNAEVLHLELKQQHQEKKGFLKKQL